VHILLFESLDYPSKYIETPQDISLIQFKNLKSKSESGGLLNSEKAFKKRREPAQKRQTTAKVCHCKGLKWIMFIIVYNGKHLANVVCNLLTTIN
jgi:hypothetical protein